MKWILRIPVALFVVLALAFVICVWVGRRLTIGHDTTRITSPLDHGYPDYLAWLNQTYGAGVTAKNNAAPLILAIAGPGDAPAAQLNEIYRIWGLPRPAEKPSFISYETWANPTNPGDAATAEEMRLVAAEPWKASEHPQVQKWLEGMEPALSKLDEATRRSRFFVPAVTEDGYSNAAPHTTLLASNFPGQGRLKAMGMALCIRALGRLQLNDDAGFRQDVAVCQRFSRLLAQQPSLIEHLVARAVEDEALHAIETAAASPINAPTTMILRRQLDAQSPFPSPVRAIDESERFALLETICMMHRFGAAGMYAGPGVPAASGGSSFIPANFNGSLRDINATFDRLVLAMGLPTADRQIKAMGAIEQEVKGRVAGGGFVYLRRPGRILEDMLMAISVPGLTRVAEINAEGLENWDLARTALALRAAKLGGGAFPDSLSALESQGFHPPLDRFNDKPLIYHREGQGYILYSVGPNQKDDGGTPRPSSYAGRGWDIVVKAEK